MIGQRIKEERERAGFTQAEFARAIHRPKSAVSMWESGSRTPSPVNQLAIARALKVAPESLNTDVKPDCPASIAPSPKSNADVLIKAEGWVDGDKGVWKAEVNGEPLMGEEIPTTLPRMELTAAIRGLERVGDGWTVVVETPSETIVRGMLRWIDGWCKRGWRKSRGQPVENKDLWMKLNEHAKRCSIDWRKTP